MKHVKQRRPYLNKLSAEINVVPYIDVMLVLLVIFMITAPLLTQGVKVNLPQAASKPLPSKQTPLIVSVDQQGLYYLNSNPHPNQAVSPQQLLSQVSARLALKNNPPSGIYVKGDRAVNYGKVVQAMVLLQKAGASNVGLITEERPQSTS